MAPQFAGVPQWPYLNLGVVDNSGYELEINYNKSFNKDLFLSVKGNFSYNHNKVKFWDEVPYADGYYYKYRTTGQSLDRLSVTRSTGATATGISILRKNWTSIRKDM